MGMSVLIGLPDKLKKWRQNNALSRNQFTSMGAVGSYGVLVVSVGFIAVYQAQRGR